MKSSKFLFRGVILLAFILTALSAFPCWSAEKCAYNYENVIIILDRSGSMLWDQPETGKNKVLYARDIASRIAENIPDADEGELFTGLKAFGYHIEDEPMKIRTIADRKQLDRGELSKSVMSIKPPKEIFGYLTPLARSIESLRMEADEWPGKTAVIIISDGQDSTFFGKPVKEAQALKEAKDDVTIFTIHMRGCKQGLKTMEQIASVGGGRMFEAVEFKESEKVKEILREILLDCRVVEEKAPTPTPPPPAPVVEKPAPPEKIIITDEMFPIILFDFDRSNIRASETPKIEEAERILKDNPTVKVRLDGHTCNIGADKYNQGLSERRAKSVKESLVERGIAEDRMNISGFGEVSPAVPNKTKELRKKNRRVEFKVESQ